MSETKGLPTNLLQAVTYFSDLDVATDFVAQLRWNGTPTCPRCGSTESSYLSTRRIWKCKGCKRQYSVKVGSIFEDSALGLDKWLPAIWLAANSKNGISSHELGRALGVTQKSAWFMLHRIRLAMRSGTFSMMSGTVEVDETYIGGKARNMHRGRGARTSHEAGIKRGRGTTNKTPVIGVIERGGRVNAQVVENIKGRTLRSYVHDNVTPGASVYTDALASYTGLSHDFDHRTVDHAERYVNGNVHTNYIENFWSLLKRGLHGTYVSVQPFHLFRYLDERMFTFNERDLTDLGRFTLTLHGIAGRRLSYAQLTGKT